MNIMLEKIGIERRKTLGNLLEFYIYEFSKYIETIEIKDDGTYGFEPLEELLTKPEFHCFLIKADERLAGFAIVEEEEMEGHLHYSMVEFFILKKGRGIGKAAAKNLFDIFRGTWVITQIKNNYPAQAFWRSVITEYTSDMYEEKYDSKRKSVQIFNNER